MVLIMLERAVIERVVTLGFDASNNEAKYEALLSWLRMVWELGIRQLMVHCNSQLIANQLIGEYAARDDWMAACLRSKAPNPRNRKC